MKPPSSLRNTSAPFPEFFITSAQDTCLCDLLLERLEKRLLVRILFKNRGDRHKTAAYLEMEFSTLCTELTRHNLLVGKTHADN